MLPYPPVRHRDSGSIGKERLYMIRPYSQSGAFFRRIGRAVVNTGDSGLMPADVIQYRLDDMRQNTKVRKSGGNSSPKIMESPGRERRPAAHGSYATIKRGLCL